MRFVLAALFLLGSALGMAVAQPVAAQDTVTGPRAVYVETTGHTVDGLFLDYWRAHQGILGDPITEEFTARTPWTHDGDNERIVQYFEGGAIAYLPEAPVGSQIKQLPLGRTFTETLQSVHAAAFRPVSATACADATPGTCGVVGWTRHTVRDGVKTFWESDAGQVLGAPLSEPMFIKDEMLQVFERGALAWSRFDSAVVSPYPLGRDIAERERLATGPIPQPDNVLLYDEALFAAPEVTEIEPDTEPAVGAAAVNAGPGPQQGGSKEIVISISRQALWAYENGELVLSTLVSTGTADIPETVTPIGYHTVLWKVDIQDMEGVLGGEYYFVADVPHVMYFDNLGNAIHGTYWHNNFGTPMSHGCVNLPIDLAAFLYDWTPVGTPVTVIA